MWSMLSSLFTVFCLVFFLGVVVWSYNPRRRAELDAIARDMLQDEAQGERP